MVAFFGVFGVNAFGLATTISAGSDLTVRWPCRTGTPTRSGACRAPPSLSPSGAGHRSVNPNATSPGLRPGAREGEPQASRCRSRVSGPSSAAGRGPGRCRAPLLRPHVENLSVIRPVFSVAGRIRPATTSSEAGASAESSEGP